MKFKIILGFLVVLAGCSNSEKLNLADVDTQPMMANANTEGEAYDGFSEVESTTSITERRKLIKTGELTFETEKLEKTLSFLRKEIANSKGYISSENGGTSSTRLSHRLTIRVPETHFDQLIKSIEGHVEIFEDKRIKSQDVTEQFLDLQVRIATKKKVEQRYLEILKQAKNVKEILEVESQIGNIRVEIESMEGRLKYLSNQTSMSTLHINCYQQNEIITQAENTFFAKIGKGLMQGVTLVQTTIIGLAHIWPLLLIGLSFILYFRFRSKKSIPAN